MIELDFGHLYTPSLAKSAILHTHKPFEMDYLVLHILLSQNKIKSVLEIGTHIGEGTQIICNAVPNALVSSLDLPESESEKTLQHPKLKGMKVGEICKLPYTQIFADSMTHEYGNYEAWFIDGEHDYAHPRHETKEAIKSGARLIIWHDADIQEVWNAITDSFEWDNGYDLCRVKGTRIAYAIKKEEI